MPRRRKCRFVENRPAVTLFKPQGVPARDLEEVRLSLEGFEALRLADHEGLEHEAAAAKMGVSRPTFSRILGSARALVAGALVNGRVIRLDGGDFVIGQPPDEDEQERPGGGFRHGRGGRGRGRGCGE